MDSIRTAILCTSMTAVALTIAECILPMEKFLPQIRATFTFLLAISMLRPLLNIDLHWPDTAYSETTSSEIADAAAAAQCDAVAVCIQNGLQRSLDEKHVACEIQRIIVHISQDGGISIDEVQITGNALTATVYLREWLGTQTVISAGEGYIP